jgi:hypothetical protein
MAVYRLPMRSERTPRPGMNDTWGELDRDTFDERCRTTV